MLSYKNRRQLAIRLSACANETLTFRWTDSKSAHWPLLKTSIFVIGCNFHNVDLYLPKWPRCSISSISQPRILTRTSLFSRRLLGPVRLDGFQTREQADLCVMRRRRGLSRCL
jgi:hypothetical protein